MKHLRAGGQTRTAWGRSGSARGSGGGSLETDKPGGAQGFGQGLRGAGAGAGSHRVGYAPQEHAHQRVGRPEHLHLLLHEMLFLGFGSEAETCAGSRCRRRYSGRRDRGGRHSLPHTQPSETQSRPAAMYSPDPGSGAHLRLRHVTGGWPAGVQVGRGRLTPPPGGRTSAPTPARCLDSPGVGESHRSLLP